MGRFSDSPYFLLEWFFHKINNTDYIERPDYDFNWPIRFVSIYDMKGDITLTGDINQSIYNTINDGDDHIWSDFLSNMWNREIHFDPNEIKVFNSYIVAPFINITTKGGGLMDLYIKEEHRGYQPITVRYVNTEGNEFNFINSGIGDITPGENIIDIIHQELMYTNSQHRGNKYTFTFWDTVINNTFNTFTNNREAYFRKDSLYHDWLRIFAHDILLDEMGVDFDIRNYTNSDKLYSYFHDIFKSHDEGKCRIIFDGMKDYVMRAVPEHQRTANFTELCNVFFDQLYQEMFDLLKNIWSLIDPLEADDRYLGYLSQYYDMFDVEIENAPLLQIREFIRDMIWMIKRKGTYTEFYILWRILTTTKNVLSVYERWHRKDVQNFPEWPSTVTPSATATWPNFPYYSNTNPLVSAGNHYTGYWPYEFETANSTTVVPPSAWVDVLYIYRDEYESPTVSGGAGYGWYRKWYPQVYDTRYSASGSYMPDTTTTTISGDNLMLSPHYILETDISYQPLDKEVILTKEIWDTMYDYWEYIRPVNRVSNYRIVEAPITDISGKYIHLYDISSDSSAYLKTKSGITLDIEDDAYVHDQKDVSTDWRINHNLGEDILLQVFDDNLDEIVPKEIEYTQSTAVLKFHTGESGFAIVKAAQWAGTRYTPTIDQTWRIYHNLGDKEVIIHYKHDQDRFYAQDTELLEVESGGFIRPGVDATFSDTEANSGMAGPGNYVYIQSVPSDEWVIDHDPPISMKGVIMAVYTNDNIRLHPGDYTLLDSNSVRIKFDEPVSGYAVFISVGDLSIEDLLEELEELVSSVTFKVYTHDELGNRTLVEEGDYVKVYSDDTFFYFDFMLDTGSEYIINEIELFDSNSDVLFHSLMSDLYKPPGVDMTFHYRLEIPRQ